MLGKKTIITFWESVLKPPLMKLNLLIDKRLRNSILMCLLLLLFHQMSLLRDLEILLRLMLYCLLLKVKLNTILEGRENLKQCLGLLGRLFDYSL
jgi:hypothetical protein